MKKILIAVILLLAAVLILGSCGDESGKKEDTAASETTVTAVEESSNLSDETTAITEESFAADTTAEEMTAVARTNPVITLSSTDALTVKAGETVALPTVSAVDYDGKDITSSVKIQDSSESKTINDGKFCGLIAGEHTIYYHIDTEDGRLGEAFLTVNVTPVRENTFDEKDANDASNMASYKEFRESFEKGRRSALLQEFSDGIGACYVSAGEEAIEGNSLIINVDSIGGATQTSLFFNCFTNQFKTDAQATYKVTFNYKLIAADDNTSDIYFGLKWDGMDGMNRNMIQSGAKVGEVYTFTAEFPATTVPSGKNASFFIFQLHKAAAPIKLAIDNFVVETIAVEQMKNDIPTASEMTSGYAWDFTDHTATCGSGQVVPVSELGDSVRNAISGNAAFSSRVLKLTGTSDHLFDGLAEDNFIYSKRLVLEMDYYAVNDQRFYLIMMGRTGNPTQTVTVTENGAFKHVVLDTVIQEGWYQLNIYGQNNPDFEIYVGNIKVTLTDRVDDGKTPGGHEIGFTFSQNSREFGNAEKNGWDCGAYDSYDFGADAAKMGDAPTKFTITNVKDVTMEWFRSQARMEIGYKYKITVTYYVDSFTGGKMIYNFDNVTFMDIGEGDYMSQGFHESTVEWTADRTVDYFNFYLDGNSTYNGVIYVKGVTVELLGK